MNRSRLKTTWRNDLRFNSAKDAVKPDGSDYTDQEITNEADLKYETSSTGDYYIHRLRYPLKREALINRPKRAARRS